MAKKVIFFVTVNLAVIAALLVGTAERPTDDVWRVGLSDCDLDYHTSIQSVALACPGVDYMWPLPVAQPWGDPTDEPGWYAQTPPDAACFCLNWSTTTSLRRGEAMMSTCPQSTPLVRSVLQSSLLSPRTRQLARSLGCLAK